MASNKKDEAVERLLNADKKVYTDAEKKKDPGKEYRTGFIDKIPSWVLALFVKFWFAGAVCFFILWGLGGYVSNGENMFIVMTVVLGLVTDILVNNVFRFFETYKGQNSRWMMFPQKKYWTFFANIFYAGIVYYFVMYIYQVINVLGNVVKGTEHEMILGAEPLLFGIFYTAVDMCFIGIKNTFIKIINDAKQKNGQ